jgi:hypothetical protein
MSVSKHDVAALANTMSDTKNSVRFALPMKC